MRNKWTKFLPSLFFCVAIVSYSMPAQGATLNVPGTYKTIQGAIDASLDDDLVLVDASGSPYVENLFIRRKKIILRAVGDVTIDGNKNGSVIKFQVDKGSLLEGFCLVNGSALNGGGIYCGDASPTISNCKISNNSATNGGGIACYNTSSPTIANCIISNNSATNGAGIETNPGSGITGPSNPLIINCTITNNSASTYGGGIDCTAESAPLVINCTNSNNSAGSKGGAVKCWDNALLVVVNSILWGNQAPSDSGIKGGYSATVCYSDINGWTETGGTRIENIDADPLFVGNGDYHLTSNSPCIDAGTDDTGLYSNLPHCDIDFENRPQDGNGDSIAKRDMGSDEYPVEPTIRISANKSIYNTGETTSVSPRVINAGPTTVADVYIRLLLPNGSAPLYYPGWKPTAKPIVSSWSVTDWGPNVLFSHNFKGGEPQGRYTLESYLTEPGTTNIIGQKKIVNFTFNKVPHIPAFPGAEGFGSETIGGRGGKVIKVTNLNDSGPGSLREALDASGPRIVVFDVAGIIDLNTDLTVVNPYLTIAGQTAPGNGICLKRATLDIQTHDVIIRGLRSRPGDEAGTPQRERDAMSAGPPWNNPELREVYNVIVDHCSFSWATDENVSTWTDAVPNKGVIHDVTYQWNIISEGIGTYKLGALLGKHGSNVSFHHNLLAHNDNRNPRISGMVSAEVVNNLIYDWGTVGATNFNPDKSIVHVINNYYKSGYIYKDSEFQFDTNMHPESMIYIDGNFSDDPTNPTGEVRMQYAEDRFLASSPLFDPSNITVTNYTQAYDDVLAGAGATAPVLDQVDSRIIQEVKDRTGGKISSQSEVGGWPTYNGTPAQDTDSDGMPDAWESARGLKINFDDSALDRDSDGYTNIEEYINSFFN